MTCVRNTTIFFLDVYYPGEKTNFKTLNALDYVKIALIITVMAGTLLGNFCVIMVVALNKTMRTVINIYMANLACADLLVCSICMTSFLWKNMLNNHVFILGPVMCKLISFCQMITMTSSVFILTAIACDRAKAILLPFCDLKFKPRTRLVITAVWVVSISVSVPLLFVRTHYTIHLKDFVQENCGDSWPEAIDEETGTCETLMWIPKLYYTFVSVTLFFLPVGTMTVTYSLILWRMGKPAQGVAETNLTSLKRNKKKTIQMVFTVLIVFIICWMPIQLLVLYDKYRRCSDDLKGCPLPYWYEEATRVTEFLAFSNSFLNPIIYCGFNKDFRDHLCRCLKPCNKRSRRFGSPRFIGRFRTTLTTAMSSSLRTTSLRDPAAEMKKRKEETSPTAANGTVLCGVPEENSQQVHEAENDASL